MVEQKENDFRDYSYDFVISLFSAIERFTKTQEEKDPKVFMYKNRNLKYALERALYFNYVDNEKLYEIFLKSKENSDEIFTVEDDIEKDLAIFTSNLPKERIVVRKKNWKLFLKMVIKKIIKFTIKILQLHKFARLVRIMKNKKTINNRKLKTVFCVEKEKFARYFEPISSKMDDFIYLAMDKKTSNYLKSKNIKYVEPWFKLYFIERWAKKNDLLYKFVIYDKFDLIGDIILELKPKIAVVAEGNAPFDEIVNQLCKKNTIKCICIQQGWSPIFHNGFRNMTYSKMLVWGKGFAKLLQPYNPNQKFVITGSHNIEEINPDNLKIDINNLKIVFFIQYKSRLLDHKKNFLFVDLAKWITENLPKMKIILAGKGSIEITKKMEKIKEVEIIKDPEKTPLQQIFDMGDIIISAYSTVILESAALGKLPIIFNVTSIPKFFPDMDSMGTAIEFKDLNDIKNTLKKIYTGEININDYNENMKKFRKEFFAYNKETAIKNIIKEVTND